MCASEKRDIDQALDAVERAEAYIPTLLGRLRRHMTIEPGASVLDIGAAQGAYLTALTRAGFEARGVEPWQPAIETSRELAAQTGVETDISHGRGESLPFADASFDLALAVSVMEHVDDPEHVFREVARVLRPGGGFYFYTSTRLSPRQAEIAGFPLFPWYPDRLRRRIMHWAIENRPHLVGGTQQPAYHWFMPAKVRRSLAAAGFSRTVDFWHLMDEDALTGAKRAMILAARRSRLVEYSGYFAGAPCAFLAVK